MTTMDVKPKLERPSPPLSLLGSTATNTPSTPTPRPSGPQLMAHLPRAEAEAMKTFIEIPDNIYQYKTLGLSKQMEEGLTCDCTYEPGIDNIRDACGDGSNCINRLTQVECLEDDCRCRSHCQNQRFQCKQYAAFHIIQTEMKGFGLRASVDMRKDTFIYEYIGEVVSHPSFAKRMREYAEEGIRHFYFMMLQKDEFIDATKKGGVGRFANHSCNPNCYVAKWTVGKKVRMGIFAKRAIKKDEELTFNYNVDRYGHEAQPCYCGETQCIGFIGGKTQTDIAAMDDVVLDALGVAEEVELLNLKGSKRKKSKKLDEDFVPIVKPLKESDAAKVIQAIRQTSNRKLLIRLLSRIKCTEDQPALREIMRLRGFSMMNTLLRDYATDVEMCTLIMECLSTWPLLSRNKVEDSKIEEPVKILLESQFERLKQLAEKLTEQWSKLELAYRIPKRVPHADSSNGADLNLTEKEPEESRPTKRLRFGEQDIETPTLAIKPLGRTEHIVTSTPLTREPPVPTVETRSTKPTKQDIAAIIAAATAAISPAPSTSDSKSGSKSKNVSTNGTPKKLSSQFSSKQTDMTLEQQRETRVLKLVGAVVVKSMSKYQSKLEHGVFKKHAKTITHLIAEKEKRSSNYQSMKLDTLPDDKKIKIKKFVKEYVGKLLRRVEAVKARTKVKEIHRKSGDAECDSSQDKGAGSPGHEDISPTALDVAELLMSVDEEGDGDESGDEEKVVSQSQTQEEPWEPDRQPNLQNGDARLAMDVVSG